MIRTGARVHVRRHREEERREQTVLGVLDERAAVPSARARGAAGRPHARLATIRALRGQGVAGRGVGSVVSAEPTSARDLAAV
jgi:hypothetical protein